MLTKKQFKAAILALATLYILIFAARSAYDLIYYDEETVGADYYYSSMKEGMLLSGNVASLRKEYSYDSGIQILDQKYERIATLSAKTVSFDADLAKLDAAIEEARAVIQMENAQGLTGERRLYRVIGVKPEYFESCLAAIKEIGILVSSSSQTIDKTYEYRQLVAQKQELEKRLESYIALRSHSGSIQERLSLEEKIIEVESQLLQQAVDLGEYSDDNALCTINVSMYEGNPISPARKIWNAFTWTNACYFATLGGLLLLAVTAFVLVKVYLFLRDAVTEEKKPKGGDDSGQNQNER